MRSGTSRYQRYSSCVQERSQSFSASVEPGWSGNGLPVPGSMPVRGVAHCATKVDRAGNTPAVHGAGAAPLALVGLLAVVLPQAQQPRRAPAAAIHRPVLETPIAFHCSAAGPRT